MYLWPAATSLWQMCTGNECGLGTSGQLRLCCQYFITKAEICLVPTKPAMKAPNDYCCATVPTFSLYSETLGPVIGIRVLNWMDSLCQYIEPYIPIISFRHNPRSVGFNSVSDLDIKVKWNCHTVLSQAVFYTTKNWGKSGAEIKTQQMSMI